MKTNNLIKISSIIYLIIALMVLPKLTMYGGVLLTIGIILLSYSFLSSEELKEKRILLIIISIISVILNFISSIPLFIANDELSKIKRLKDLNEEIISSENKRIDILLKIGLGMILISGVLFATTSWNVIPNFTKCIGLIMMGIIFIGMSKFSEKKLKIEKTTKAYFVLGLGFFLLTFIGIGVFGTISPWFSYYGDGKNLVYFLTFILLAILLLLIYNKFKQREYKFLAYICNYLSIYHLLIFIGLNIELTTLTISAIILIINILSKDNNDLVQINQTISYIFLPIIIMQESGNFDPIQIITSLINITNIIYLVLKNKIEKNIAVIIIYVLTINIAIKLQIKNPELILFFLISSVYLVFNQTKIESFKKIQTINQIIYHIISTITIISMFNQSFELFICSIIYTILNFINSYIKNPEHRNIDLYYQPIILLLTTSSIFKTIGDVTSVNYIHILTSIIVIYALMHYTVKDNKIKKIYYIALIITTILTAFINLISLNILIALLLVLSSIYIYRASNKSIPAYIQIILSLLLFEGVISEYILQEFITDIITIFVFCIITYIYRDNQKLKRINLIAMVVPMYALINNINIYGDIKIILNNIFAFYILLLFITLYIKNNKKRDIVATIFTSLIIFEIIFSSSLLIGIYIGIISILIIFITYNKNEFKSLFYCGLTITIINIVIQLGGYWARIPLWLYLLLAGVVIVAFVTYKELKKQKEPTTFNEIKSITQEEIITQPKSPMILPKTTNFCPNCGNQNKGNNYCTKCGQSLMINR